jgi:hypothetical protein
MKKYKLIKEYPGSPKLGTIVEVKRDGYIYWNVNSNINNPTNYIHDSAMEQYKEFWEKVVEKDYEILSFITLDNKIIVDKSKYNNSQETWETAFNFLENYKIHSVKRISDGEIFTIGDNVKIVKSTNPCCEQGIIKDFSFWLDNINNLTKIKQPLFTTEDGVDIFEGDIIYSIDNVLNIKKHRLFNARYDDKTLLSNYLFFNSDYEHFSTKEKAEEYVLMNKDCLSLQDINNYLDQIRKKKSYFKKCEDEIEFQFELKTLVKNKLKIN